MMRDLVLNKLGRIRELLADLEPYAGEGGAGGGEG